MKNNKFYKKPLSNIYKKPSVFSEVTSQILYGEKFKILSKNNNWLKIKTSFDNYIGYIQNKNFVNEFKPTHKIFKLKSQIFIRNHLKFLRLLLKLYMVKNSRFYRKIKVG